MCPTLESVSQLLSQKTGQSSLLFPVDAASLAEMQRRGACAARQVMEGSGSGEKLSLSCQCPQSKTSANIIPCILKFTSRVEAAFEKCGFSSFIEEHLFFMAEGLS